MQFQKIRVSERAAKTADDIERTVNRLVRGYDGLKSRLHLGGRKANYDDHAYEFVGGAKDTIRSKHYDKSMRLLWKAEDHAPWLSFRDCTKVEKQMWDMAARALTDEEREAVRRLSLPEYRELLNREYTPREKEAIVTILAAIGHGEAYAWLVSAALLNEVKSTGGRSALTMQVVEEAKHFVVLRELLDAFDVPIRRQSAWEYLLLEQVYKSKGVEKFFGMNIVVESIALGFFGLMSELPGLEVLRLFHLDEARHTALPGNYLKEFPLTRWQRINPAARMRRLRMILPALALIPTLEADMAELGIDAFTFGGSVIRKIATLAQRAGFDLPVDNDKLFPALNQLFNAYCSRTRPDHAWQDYLSAEATVGKRQLAVERSIFDGTLTTSDDPSISVVA
jgi:hypothetical protein